MNYSIKNVLFLRPRDSINNISYDNLKIMFKAGLPYLTKVNLKN
jgi:hypothetical protein